MLEPIRYQPSAPIVVVYITLSSKSILKLPQESIGESLFDIGLSSEAVKMAFTVAIRESYPSVYSCSKTSCPDAFMLRYLKGVVTFDVAKPKLKIRSEAWPPIGERAQIAMSAGPARLNVRSLTCVTTVLTIVALPSSRSRSPRHSPRSRLVDAMAVIARPNSALYKIGNTVGACSKQFDSFFSRNLARYQHTQRAAS